MTWRLHQPADTEAAVHLLDELGPAARPVAGGTALVPELKSGVRRPEHLVSLRGLARELGSVRIADGALVIGALTTLDTLHRHAAAAQALPAFGPLLAQVANVRIRHVATLGGSLAQADPGYDPQVLLAAVGARVRVCSTAGERWVELPDPDAAVGALDLRPGELATAVEVPASPPRTATAAGKLTPRTELDRGVVTVACRVTLDATHERVEAVRIVVGGAGPRPVRAGAAESLLQSAPLDSALLDRLASLVGDPLDAAPSDARGSADYRRAMAGVLARRLVARAAAEVTGQSDYLT